MLVRTRKGWELPERAATPESVYLNRRTLIKGLAAGPILLGAPALLAGCDEAPQAAESEAVEADPSAALYPVPRNERYTLDRPITDPQYAVTYNNYYEFGSSKNIWRKAQALPIRPWIVTLDGMVEPADRDRRRRALGQNAFGRAALPPPLRRGLVHGGALERLCHEGPGRRWPSRSAAAKYVSMVSFLDPQVAPGQKAPPGIPGPISRA